MAGGFIAMLAYRREYRPDDPADEGTSLKPDISLATKTGHFNLLRAFVRKLFEDTREADQERSLSEFTVVVSLITTTIKFLPHASASFHCSDHGRRRNPSEDRESVPLLGHRVFAFHIHHSAILVLRRGVRALTPNALQLSNSARERPSAFDAFNHTFRLPVFHNGPMEAEVELIAVVHIADISSTG